MDAGALLIGLGAIILLVSLFLVWYQPNAEAWDVFEVWDLVLAALAIAALVAVAGRLGFGPARGGRDGSLLIGAALAALVIVLYALIDPPPAADAIGTRGGGFGDPGTGLWLALAASVLMTAGTLASVARISVAFSTSPSSTFAGGHRRAEPFVDPDGSNPAVAQPPHVADPPSAAPAGTRGSGRSPGGRPTADPEAADPRDIPQTQPTRRL